MFFYTSKVTHKFVVPVEEIEGYTVEQYKEITFQQYFIQLIKKVLVDVCSDYFDAQVEVQEWQPIQEIWNEQFYFATFSLSNNMVGKVMCMKSICEIECGAI